jgi:pyruvate/2-oxoglutarate dehydrogenase complex dihydrolipoamide acyltransferase (E2) component
VMEYRNVGNHVEDLADGRMLAPGESVTWNGDEAKEDRNADLIDRGVLLRVDEINATDAAVELADQEDVALTAVTGTGSSGQVTKPDVERYIREAGEES